MSSPVNRRASAPGQVMDYITFEKEGRVLWLGSQVVGLREGIPEAAREHHVIRGGGGDRAELPDSGVQSVVEVSC